MKRLLFTMMVVWVTAVVAKAQSAEDFIGTWLVQDKDARVELYKTSTGKLQGKCVWHVDPNKKDEHNKDPEKRNKPVVGLIVVWDFEWDPVKKEWIDGKVYKEGKVYCGRMKLNPDGTIFLKGTICGTPLGKTNIWTRVK